MSKELKLITTIAIDWDNDEGIEETDIETSHKFEDPSEIDSIVVIHQEKVDSYMSHLQKKANNLEAGSEDTGELDDVE